MDDTKKLLSISHICQSFLAICSQKFQLVTICHRFISLLFQPLFQFVPILSGCQCILTISKHTTYIHNREIPFLFIVVPYSTDFPLFKQL